MSMHCKHRTAGTIICSTSPSGSMAWIGAATRLRPVVRRHQARRCCPQRQLFGLQSEVSSGGLGRKLRQTVPYQCTARGPARRSTNDPRSRPVAAKRKDRPRARQRARLRRRGTPLSRLVAARVSRLAGRAARPSRRAGHRTYARTSGARLQRRGTGSSGRAFAIVLARTLRQTDRAGADAVPGPLAHADRCRHVAAWTGQGCCRGPGGRLRVRGRIRAGLQAPHGSTAPAWRRSQAG